MDDAEIGSEKPPCDLPVLGTVSAWTKYADAQFIIAIGSPRTRRSVVQSMCAAGDPEFATLIDPTVRMSSYVQVGEGTVIAAGSILTTQILVGSHNLIDRNSTVGHDCVLGDYCTIAPMVSVSGNVTLEGGVEIGTGAAIRRGVRTEAGPMAGMGAVVVKDVLANQVVVGSPARHFKDLVPW